MLPSFTADGLLPPGDYRMTLAELRISPLVVGPPSLVETGSWDRAWRERLADNLSIVADQLWQVGIERIFIDGSFVEDKAHPNDIDGYFECPVARFTSGELEASLNAVDPHQAWTWAPCQRQIDPETGKWQLPLWHVYRVDLYPHFPGLLSGITDQHGHELEFPSAFRRQRGTFIEKGVVQLVR